MWDDVQLATRRKTTNGPSDGLRPREFPPKGADLDVTNGGRGSNTMEYIMSGTFITWLSELFHISYTVFKKKRSFLKVVVMNVSLIRRLAYCTK